MGTRYIRLKCMPRQTVAFALSLVLALSMLPMMPGVMQQAEAATNQSATNAINSLKTQTGFKPGACGWKSWTNPYPSGWTDCGQGCWYFAANVAQRLFGSYPSGVTKHGYTLTRPGDFNKVGTITDTSSANPSMSSIQNLMKQAYPGDIIQFHGASGGYGSDQHTAIVEAVDSNGVRIYQHTDDGKHVSSTYYSWSTFYNSYLKFNVFTSTTKGISLYHYKNYSSKYPSHTHNYNQRTNISYSYYNNVRHTIKYTAKCSCGATNGTKTDIETCSFIWDVLWHKCTKCGTEYVNHDKGVEYITTTTTPVYKGDNPNTGTLITIPKGTVIKPTVLDSFSSWGRYIAKVTYGGKTGYIHLENCKLNRSAGKHNFANGVCKQCGIKQVPSTKDGIYKASKQKTAYKGNPYSSTTKTLKVGDEIYINRVSVSTNNDYWGRTPDGYVVEMTDLIYKRSSHNGTVTSIHDGQYAICVASNTNFALDIPNYSKDNNVALQLWSRNDSKAQIFKLTRNNDDGTYYITNVNSGKVLDVENWTTADQGRILQYTCGKKNNDNQRWYVEKCPNGSYALRNKHSNLYVDIWCGAITKQTPINQYHGNGTISQQFLFMPVDGSPLINGSTGKVSGIASKYTFNGKTIAPKPKVEKLVYASQVIKVPADGKASNSTHRYAETASFKKGKTYRVEIGTVKRLAGNTARACVLPYNFTKDDAVGTQHEIAVSSSVQSRTFTAQMDGTLLLYSGWPGDCKGNALEFDDVKVYQLLDKGTDYNVSYSGCTQVGTGKVTIALMGSQTGSLSRTFKITKPSVASVNQYAPVAASKALTVKWGSRSGVSGYQVMVAKDKKFKKSKKKISIKDANKSSIKVKGLSKKKKHYVKVRAYKKVAGKTFYGRWSNVKSKKTK